MTDGVSLGGNLNDAVRVGDTVRRSTGHWTPAVHSLLRFLEARDFPAPRARGIDDRGREILEYIEGEAHSGTIVPLPERRVMADEHLVAAAKLLRRYHDLVVDYEPPADLTWRLVAPPPHELISHNDWTPWNALFRNGKLALFLDWDLAGPSSRMWSIANAALAWVPLYRGTEQWTLESRVRRLRSFAEAYGSADWPALIPTARVFIEHVGRFVGTEARKGDQGMQRLVGMGVDRMAEFNVPWLDEHRVELEQAL